MSLAELESVIEFALRNAIMTNGIIGDKEFEDAFETFNGGEKKLWSKETLENTARHEAGHALIYWLSGNCPSYVTIVARGNRGGYMRLDEEDKQTYTRDELLDNIRCSLGGRGAEIAYYGRACGVSTGAYGDLRQATAVARDMICAYGMDEKIGLASSPEFDKDSEYLSLVRARINEILNEQLELAIELISQNKPAIDAVVKVLLEKNYIKGDEIDAIFKKYAKR
jgi:cell division protease FtsH